MMQAMLTTFINMNTKGSTITPVQASETTRTYSPLFTIHLPKEEEILEDLKEISVMEYIVQVIMVIVSIAVAIIILYFCCTKCRHTHTILKHCFLLLPISHITCMTHHTDLFVEVTNVTKGNN